MSRTTSRWLDAVNGLQANPRLIVPAIGILCGAIFVVDWIEPNVIALSALYAIPILMSLWVGNRRFTAALAVICIALAMVGVRRDLNHADPNDDLFMWANRGAALFTISVLSLLGVWRLRIERKLFDTREAVTTTLESIAEGVIATDVAGRVSFMNRAAQAMTEFTEAEALGIELETVLRVVDEHAPAPPILDLPQRGARASNEGTLIAKSGARIPVSQALAPIRDSDGVIRGHVVVFRDIREQREHEEAMRRMAYRDELTGLPNRTSLADRLSLELAHARRNREMLAVCYVDLDRFKRINDTLGHQAGDEFLKAVAERLRGALRAGDTIARMGGDEFVILLPGIGGTKDAQVVARKVIDALEPPIQLEGRDLQAGASLGVALYPQDGSEPDTLLRRADKAMYRAKSHGGSHVEFASAKSASSGRA